METFDQIYKRLKLEIQAHRKEINNSYPFPTALFVDKKGRYTNHMIELKRKNSIINSLAYHRRKKRNGEPFRKLVKAHQKISKEQILVLSKQLDESKDFWRTQIQNLHDFYRKIAEIQEDKLRKEIIQHQKDMEEIKMMICNPIAKERDIYILSGLENKKEWNGEKVELIKILPALNPQEEDRCEIYLMKDRKTTKKKFLKVPDD